MTLCVTAVRRARIELTCLHFVRGRRRVCVLASVKGSIGCGGAGVLVEGGRCRKV